MKILFLGGGNMAGAMIGGLAGKLYAPSDIAVIEINDNARQRLHERWGVQVFAAPDATMRTAQVCVLAVKPQQMREAVEALAPQLAQPLIISIAAGIPGKSLASWLASERIVRCMPNTPALVGAGMTGATALSGASAEDRQLAESILRAVGEVVWVDEEPLLDAVTALSGSGPAYVFYFVEAMVKAGCEMGLSPEQAKQLALATFAGASKLAQNSEDPVSVLREKVTSKGGTTAAALDSMASDNVASLIGRALHAARNRAEELGQAFGT